MTPEAIAALQTAIPGAVRPADPRATWPEEIAHVPESDSLWEEIEEDLFPIHDPDDSDPLAEIRDVDLPPDGLIEEMGSIPDHLRPESHDTVRELSDSLRDCFGGGWAGVPGGSPILPGGATVGLRAYPPTDIYAFYLPWHRFSQDDWGIYLLAEGIAALGDDIHAIFPRVFSRTDARRAARLFLYHHEAYHNSVETFAARVEVSHRRACYLTGVRRCFATFLPLSGLQEEGLANVYAHDKVRQFLFAQEKAISSARRRVKRMAAATALRRLFQLQPPPYASAGSVLRGIVTFEAAQLELQETCHNLSSLPALPTTPNIWSAAPRAMAPSLSGHGAFALTQQEFQLCH